MLLLWLIRSWNSDYSILCCFLYFCVHEVIFWCNAVFMRIVLEMTKNNLLEKKCVPMMTLSLFVSPTFELKTLRDDLELLRFWKPEYPDKTQVCTTRTCELHVERPQISRGSCYLDDGSNHWSTMLLNLYFIYFSQDTALVQSLRWLFF